jgi:hypothetical protein
MDLQQGIGAKSMKLKELLDKPEKWTKGVCARDSNGLPIKSGDKNAVCWCLSGATHQCYPESPFEIYKKVLDAAVELRYWTFTDVWIGAAIINLNDREGITFEDIKAILEHADV